MPGKQRNKGYPIKKPPGPRMNQRLLPQEACGRTSDMPLGRGYSVEEPGEEDLPPAGAQVQADDQTLSPNRAQGHSWALLTAAERTRDDCPHSQGNVRVDPIRSVLAVPPENTEPGAPAQGMPEVEGRGPSTTGGGGEHLGQKESRGSRGAKAQRKSTVE